MSIFCLWVSSRVYEGTLGGVRDNGSPRLKSHSPAPNHLPKRVVGQPYLGKLTPLHHKFVKRSRGQGEVRKTFATSSTRPYECPMSSKRQKMTAKRGRASEEPTHSYDHDKFGNESAAEKFDLILKNRSLIKEKGFTTPMTSFTKRLRIRDGGHYVYLLAQLPQVWYKNFTPISPPMY